MKANELMIGDWVNLYDCDMIYPALVQELQGDKIFADRDRAGVCDVFEELWGIPLTPEILEKNGFELDDDGYHYYIPNTCDYYTIGYYYDMDEKCMSFQVIDFFCFDIPYVHLLQHALRLCGLTDMADNFKV